VRRRRRREAMIADRLLITIWGAVKGNRANVAAV